MKEIVMDPLIDNAEKLKARIRIGVSWCESALHTRRGEENARIERTAREEARIT